MLKLEHRVSLLLEDLPKEVGIELIPEYREALEAALAGGRAEEVDGYYVRAGEAPPMATDRADAGDQEVAPGEVLKSAVRWRQPKNQNEHAGAIVRLLSKSDQHVALVAHVLAGQSLSNGEDFCVKVHELAHKKFLDKRTGLSAEGIRKAMANAVEAGLFVRVDSGRGGRSGGRASYRAVVPENYRKP